MIQGWLRACGTRLPERQAWASLGDDFSTYLLCAVQSGDRSGCRVLIGGAPSAPAAALAQPAGAAAASPPGPQGPATVRRPTGGALLKRRRASSAVGRVGSRSRVLRAGRQGAVRKHVVRKKPVLRSALPRAAREPAQRTLTDFLAPARPRVRPPVGSAGGTLACRALLRRRMAFARRARHGLLHPGLVDALAGGLGLSGEGAVREVVLPKARATLLKRRRAPAVCTGMPTEAEAREHAANLLFSFGEVSSPAGGRGALQPKDVGGGG